MGATVPSQPSSVSRRSGIWQSRGTALERRSAVARVREDRIDDQVVLPRALTIVERCTTCDQAKDGVVESGKDPLIGKIVLGVGRAARDSEDGARPVRPGHADCGTRFELPESVEGCRAAVFAGDRAKHDRSSGLTGGWPKPVPADRPGSVERRHLQRTAWRHPDLKDIGVDVDAGNVDLDWQ